MLEHVMIMESGFEVNRDPFAQVVGAFLFIVRLLSLFSSEIRVKTLDCGTGLRPV